MKKTVKLLAAAAIALTSVSLAQPAGADDYTPSISFFGMNNNRISKEAVTKRKRNSLFETVSYSDFTC